MRFAPINPPAPKTTIGPWSFSTSDFNDGLTSAMHSLFQQGHQWRPGKTVFFLMPPLTPILSEWISFCIHAPVRNRASNSLKQQTRNSLIQTRHNSLRQHQRNLEGSIAKP